MRRMRLLLAYCLIASVALAQPVAFAEDAAPSQQDLNARAADALRLVNSADPYQRQLGFLRLEALRDPSTVSAIQPYVTSRDPELRASGLRALAAIQGVEAIPLLLNALKTDRQPQVRRAALLGLEPLQQANPEILPACIQALRDRKPEVRMAAIDIVSRIDDPRAREAILQRKRREHNRDVRRVLAMGLKRLRTP